MAIFGIFGSIPEPGNHRQHLQAMTTTTGLTPEQVANVFITSIEGGSTYWADTAEFETQNGDEWAVADYQNEETFSKTWRVRYHDRDADVWSEWKGASELMSTREVVPEHWDKVISEDYDADDVDAIIQVLFFGEIVYG